MPRANKRSRRNEMAYNNNRHRGRNRNISRMRNNRKTRAMGIRPRRPRKPLRPGGGYNSGGVCIGGPWNGIRVRGLLSCMGGCSGFPIYDDDPCTEPYDGPATYGDCMLDCTEGLLD